MEVWRGHWISWRLSSRGCEHWTEGAWELNVDEASPSTVGEDCVGVWGACGIRVRVQQEQCWLSMPLNHMHPAWSCPQPAFWLYTRSLTAAHLCCALAWPTILDTLPQAWALSSLAVLPSWCWQWGMERRPQFFSNSEVRHLCGVDDGESCPTSSYASIGTHICVHVMHIHK